AQAYIPATPQQQASDAEIILLAMIDAAKADGQIDSEEFRKITDSLKNSGVGQEGMNYVLQKLQGPMETAKIVSATRGRPDLAAQIYSASLMAIEVDTDAERMYLSKLANALGLSPQVIQNIEQLTGSNSKEYMC
ncbi:MAG: tellurite resistance TerB family protein, partial [Synergistaceae bacterium]|nr:tellurite resistance TerB family protein [Synergistaceae bacterium]